MLNRRGLGAAAFAALASAPRVPRAQVGPAATTAPWPGERPIEAIVPFPPGGGVDVMTRILMPIVAQHLGGGAKTIVSNRSGAGGQLGFEAMFNAPPDGWTIGAISAPALQAIPIERPTRYRVPDFTYIANVVDDANAFYVRADSPFRSLADLVAAARARPGTVTYATTGVGSDDHIAMLAFQQMAGFPPMVHVPYAGGAPVMQAILGGHVDMASGNLSEAIAQAREGRTRYLAGAAPERWSVLPEVPTFRESGYDLVAGASRGFVGPPGMPPAVVERLRAAFAAAIADPAFQREAERQFLPLRPLVGEAYRSMIAEMDTGLRRLWQRHPWRE
jgi:tripartite-type tricarboxylate transporter receptor subunit TctC